MKYGAIVVDPPWAYQQRWQQAGKGNALSHDGLRGIFKRGGKGGEYSAAVRGAAANYDCMTLGEIAAMPIGEWADENAHIYVWTTNAFIRDTFPLLEAWGFAYKTTITWAKHQLGMGMYFRNTTEHVLFGVRGKLKLLRRDVPTHIIAPRGRHSEKPAAFYDLIETCSPGPRLDVFARAHRFGWDVAIGIEAGAVVLHLPAHVTVVTARGADIGFERTRQQREARAAGDREHARDVTPS